MYVRRKNCEYGRIKRSSRKNKSFDTFSNNFGSYFKLLLAWSTIMTLDFLLEFRFEYMWPCWLLIRTINDSFKYQGLAFAIFFTIIALLSDFICYILVPSSLLFLFGSTCVWIELVWHAERGMCVPTVALCFLFLYMEVAVRLRDPKSILLSIDLCRPFAAHCIGYPVVTLGFGLKSLLSHQFRVHKQRSVQSQNRKYFCLLESALPHDARSNTSNSKLANGELPAAITPAQSPNQSSITCDRDKERSSALVSLGGKERNSRRNLVNSNKLVVCEAATITSCASSRSTVDSATSITRPRSSTQNNSSSASTSLRFRNSALCDNSFAPDTGSIQLTKGVDEDSSTSAFFTSSCEVVCASPPLSSSASSSNTSLSDPEDRYSESAPPHLSASLPKKPVSSSVSSTGMSQTTSSIVYSGVKSSSHRTAPLSSQLGESQVIGRVTDPKSNNTARCKDPLIQKLEEELRKLRNERQVSSATEVDLRSQVAQLTANERTARTETAQVRQEVINMQSKLTNLNQRFQTERNNRQSVEKRLADERRQRITLEQQLAVEKKIRKDAEEKEVAKVQPIPQTSKVVGKVVGSNRVSPIVASTSTTTVRTNISTNTVIFSTAPCTSETCVSRVLDLETQLKSMTRELAAKEVKLALLPSPSSLSSTLTTAHGSEINLQSNQKIRKQAIMQAHNDRQLSELLHQMNELQQENMRLTATLKDEDKMKQELISAYHTSLKEITELNSTLTQKEFQICDLHSYLDSRLYMKVMEERKMASNMQSDPSHSNSSAFCSNDSDNCNLHSSHFMPSLSVEGANSTALGRHIPSFLNGSGNNYDNIMFPLRSMCDNVGVGNQSALLAKKNSDIDMVFSFAVASSLSDFGSGSQPGENEYSNCLWASSSMSQNSSCQYATGPLGPLSSFDQSTMSGNYTRNGFPLPLSDVFNSSSTTTGLRSHPNSSDTYLRNETGFINVESLLTPRNNDDIVCRFPPSGLYGDDLSASFTQKRINSYASTPHPPTSSLMQQLNLQQQNYLNSAFKAPPTSTTMTCCSPAFQVTSPQMCTTVTLGGPENMSTPAYLNQLRSQMVQRVTSINNDCSPCFNNSETSNNCVPFTRTTCITSASVSKSMSTVLEGLSFKEVSSSAPSPDQRHSSAAFICSTENFNNSEDPLDNDNIKT